MQEALTNLPESLGAIYADVLANKIPKDYMEKARFILIWLYHSLTPLTLGEVARVTSLPEPRDVLDICTSSLVSLQRKKGSSHKLTDDYDDYDDYDDMEGLAIVQIDHFSVKEYLASEDMASSQEAAYFYLTPLVAHLTIAAMSVAYMIKNNEPKILARYDYASTWFKHIQMADAIDYNTPTSKEPRSKAQTTVSWSEVESLRVQIHRLFCKEHLQTFRNWALLCSPSTSEHGSSYHFVGRWEFAMALSNSPIAMTALLNLPDNMRRLLTSGARADGDYGDANISTTEITNPLQIAAIVGNLDIMKLLLESNARLETSELDVIASQNGRHGAAVLSTLLKAQPDLEISDKFVLRSANNPNSVDIFHYILGTSMLYNPTDEVLMLRTDKVLMRRPKANSVLRSAWNSGVSPRAPESIEYDSASFSDWF